MIYDVGGLLLSMSYGCLALLYHLSKFLLVHRLSLLDNFSNFGNMDFFGLLPNFPLWLDVPEIPRCQPSPEIQQHTG